MKLLGPFRIRDVELRNRIVVSPMCQYSATNGHPQTWHLGRLGSRAVGGAALVMAEATTVEARGRISPGDTGIFEDSHIQSWRPVAEFIRSQGALPGIQLAHAGRKASTTPPWEGGKAIPLQAGGWVPVAPSAIAFADDFAVPEALGAKALGEIVEAFQQAAMRALSTGFDVLEIHAAHGYLLHEFLSPLCNTRADEYGGAFENPHSTSCSSRAKGLATKAALVCAIVRDGLEGRWLGFGAGDLTVPEVETAGSGFD